ERQRRKTADAAAAKAKVIAAAKTALAEIMSKESLKNAMLADERGVTERRTRYLTEFKAAWKAWQENKTTQARALLDRQLPPDRAAADLRGFEWFYLDRLLNEGFLSLTVDS